MKFKKILTVVALAAVVVSMAACKKNRFCHCVSLESYIDSSVPGMPVEKYDTVVVTVDRSLKCDHLLEIGLDRLIDGEWQMTTQKVSCLEIDADSVPTIPPRPTEDD